MIPFRSYKKYCSKIYDSRYELVGSYSLFLSKFFSISLMQEGATREDIEKLLKYKFRRLATAEKPNGEIQGPSGGVMIECGTDSPTERILAAEDLVCCLNFLTLTLTVTVVCPR